MILCPTVIGQTLPDDSVQSQTDSIFQTLSEVVVTANRKLIKLENGRISVDLPSMIKGTGITTIFDALGRTPGLFLTNDKLEMVGTSSFSILFNGSSLGIGYDQLVNLLKSLPVERLAGVELMYAAPPETGIKGAAINIIIVDANTDAESMQGNVTARGTFAEEWQTAIGSNILYNKKKWQAELNLSSNFYNHKKSGVDMEMRHLLNGSAQYLYQKDLSKINSPDLGVYTALTFKPDKENSLRLQYYYNGIWSKTTSNALLSLNDSEEYNSEIQASQPSNTHYVTFEFLFPKIINATFGYTYSDFKANSNLLELGQVFEETSEFGSSSSTDINSFSLRLNRTADKIGKVGLSYGLNGSFSRNNTNNQYSQNGQTDPTLRSTFNEWMASAFAGITWQPNDKYSLNAYLTGELYHLEEKNGTVYSKRFNWYPQLTFSYLANRNHILQLNVTSTKQYPTFAELSPGERYLTPYTSVIGNPYLVPSQNYTMTVNYIISQRYVVTAFGIHSPNAIFQQPYQRTDKLESIIQSVNFDYSSQAGLSVHLPIIFKKVNGLRITPQLTSAYKIDKLSDFYGLNIKKDKFIGQGSLQINYKLPIRPSIYIDLVGQATTTSIQGLYDIRPMQTFSAAITYQFLKDKAKLVLSGQDIFNSSAGKTRIDYEGQWSRMDMRTYNPAVSLTFSYAFGGFKKSSNNIDTKRYKTKIGYNENQ